MNLRWLFGDFSDPHFALDPAVRKEVMKEAHNEYLPDRRLAWTTAALVIGALILFAFAHRPIAGLLAWLGVTGHAFRSMPWAWLGAAAVLLLVIWIGSAWCYRWIYVRPIRQALRARGYDLCLACGYWLKGLDETINACPECGAEREGDA